MSSTTTDGDDDKNKNTTTKKDERTCPVSETWRHVLYIGGMVALHAGMGATAVVGTKPTKCPLGEWARHAVYTGAAVALLAMLPHHSHSSHPAVAAESNEPATPKKWYQVCPLNEWGKHAVYVAGMVGIVALVNARKK